MTPVEEFIARGGIVENIPRGKRTKTEQELYVSLRDDRVAPTPCNTSLETAFAKADRLTGGTLSDRAVLTIVERSNIR